jgi:Mn-dependent DtxR family transcriptional regulator
MVDKIISVIYLFGIPLHREEIITMDGMKIGDVARQLKIHPTTIRRLEKNGLIRPQRTLTGYRIFTPETVEKIRGIYEGKHES